MKGVWVPHDTRDQIVDFVTQWTMRAEITSTRILGWMGLPPGKYHTWKGRYGKATEHNGQVPRDFWLEEWEKQAILQFREQHPLESCRCLAFMMLDKDIVAVSPSSVYRVLREAGMLRRWNTKPSQKGTGFVQPLSPHEHWHMDISHLNVCGTFYYLCSVLDGSSRYIVHWEIHEQMTEREVEIVLQRARELFPDAHPRIISDNGPQFIARDFKEFIRISGMTHVRTSPYYPQSNGKIERLHRTLKSECLRPGSPLSLEDARRLVKKFVLYYNTERLHGSIGYVTPIDKLEGRDTIIQKLRDHKLELAREQRRLNRLRVNQNLAAFNVKNAPSHYLIHLSQNSVCG